MTIFDLSHLRLRRLTHTFLTQLHADLRAHDWIYTALPENLIHRPVAGTEYLSIHVSNEETIPDAVKLFGAEIRRRHMRRLNSVTPTEREQPRWYRMQMPRDPLAITTYQEKANDVIFTIIGTDWGML